VPLPPARCRSLESVGEVLRPQRGPGKWDEEEFILTGGYVVNLRRTQ
jgi:hypothetical protein